MAKVPYQPFATESPSGARTPNVQANIPDINPAAFGGTVALATQHLGDTVQHASGEIFTRALALQQLANETEATDADSRYMEKSGLRHAEFSAKQGKEAVDAYPAYIQGLKDDRQEIRDSLSNPMAQKMYDRSSLGTQGRSIFNGAGHAATQQKVWSIGSAKAQMDLDVKAVEDDPQDPKLYEAKRRRVQAGADQIAGLQGYEAGGPQAKDLALRATSKLRAQQLIGLSRVAPFEAAAKLDEFKTELTQDDYLKVDNTVRAQGRAVGSVNIANKVYDEGKGSDERPGKSLSEMEAEARAKAKEMAPNDPILEQHAVAAVRGVYNQDKYAKQQETIANRQTVAGAIAKGSKDEQTLRADPIVAAAIDALPKTERLNIPARINSYNAAKDKVANQEHYNTLIGMSNNDVEGFLNLDPMAQNLSQGQMQSIMKRQAELKKNQNQDPRVDRAIGWMRGAMGAQMEALGVFRRTANNKDDYDHLTGTVQSALDVWQQDHQKPPSYKEFVDQIAPQVLSQRDEPGMLWGTNKKPFFTQEVPDKFSSQLKADVIAGGGVEPSEEQIYKAYVRTQLIKLYGKKDSK